jgi:hypothetical protein
MARRKLLDDTQQQQAELLQAAAVVRAQLPGVSRNQRRRQWAGCGLPEPKTARLPPWYFQIHVDVSACDKVLTGCRQRAWGRTLTALSFVRNGLP